MNHSETPESALQSVHAFEKYLLDEFKKSLEKEIDNENDRVHRLIMNGESKENKINGIMHSCSDFCKSFQFQEQKRDWILRSIKLATK